MDSGDTSDQATAQTNVVVLPNKAEELPVHRKAAEFVREHPVATVAGGLALGAIAAALIPRGNRAFVARKSSLMAEAIAAASAAVAQQALGSLDTASSGVKRGAHSLASLAEHAGEVVADRASGAAHAAYERAQALLGRKTLPPTLGERIAARAGEIAGRLRK